MLSQFARYAFQCLRGHVVILASAIAGTRFRRIREVVVLKDSRRDTATHCGSPPRLSLRMLGLVAATGGLIFANVGARLFSALCSEEIDYHFQPGLKRLFAMAITAALTVAAGWLREPSDSGAEAA